MGFDFSVEPEFQGKLDWIEDFLVQEVEPLDYIIKSPYDLADPVREALIPPLQRRVKDAGLWACHLGPELGGPGLGQVKLALMNEKLGRCKCGPIVFGCQAPDSGNAEVLAHYGTAAQKERYLKPLLDNKIVSCYSMTEPQGGSDPTMFECRATFDEAAREWVINGEKWFSTNARYASFLIAMVVTDPAASNPYRRCSQLLVPHPHPGLTIKRNIGLGYESEANDEGGHAYIIFENCRIPEESLLGKRGGGFVVAQTRLGGGRIHHAMRAVGVMKKAFDAMCERVKSRVTQGEPLAKKQMVQDKIADSWAEIEMFRLLVLRTAWRIDTEKDYQKVRHDISAVKFTMPKVLHDVSARALQLHGSLGASWEMPFCMYLLESFHMGLADGATEVHKLVVARQMLARYQPSADRRFPSGHIPTLRDRALAKYSDVLERVRATAPAAARL